MSNLGIEVGEMRSGDRLLVALGQLSQRGEVTVKNIGKTGWSVELEGPSPFDDGMEWNHADLVKAAEALLEEVEEMEAINAEL